MTLVELPSPHPVSFSHRGDYSAEATGRPVVEVEFATVDGLGVLLGSYETGVMVDSGAARTVLGHNVAAELGLGDLSSYPLALLQGAVPGSELPCSAVEVLARLCGVWIPLRALFPRDDVPVRHLLGRDDVFDRVRFGFGGGERAVYAGVGPMAHKTPTP
ncbi:MAG: hypothetical protein ABR992_19355 [Solirubrobacteraceae bacterium]